MRNIPKEGWRGITLSFLEIPLPWIESHSVLIRHRKLKEFARSLGVKPVVAMGHLHALWHTAIEQAEDGDLSKWTVGSIADAAAWEGSEQEFLNAAFSSGFMDEGQLLHDWLDYAGKYLTSKYKTSNKARLEEIWAKFGRKYGKEFLTPSSTLPLDRPHNQPTLPDITEPDLTKPKHKPPLGVWFEDSRFVAEWKAWEKARKSKAGERQYAKLERLSGGSLETAIAILKESADNGWTGIFELKGTKNGTYKPNRAEKLDADAERLYERLTGTSYGG